MLRPRTSGLVDKGIDDEDIDYSDIPEIDEETMKRGMLVPPRRPQAEGVEERIADYLHSTSTYPTSIRCARSGASLRANELGMRPMQQRAYESRGEQYLLIKSPPASGKSRALMFIALDKIHNQGLKQAIIAVPERTIGSSFADAPLSEFGFWADWQILPRWNLCNAPGTDRGKVQLIGDFLDSEDKFLLCTHASFRFAVERYGVRAFDNRLLAIDEFHHVSTDTENKLGSQLTDILNRNKTHIVAMTGSYFRGDAEPILDPCDETRFETVTYTYYEQLNGYEHLKYLNINHHFYTGPYTASVAEVLNPNRKTIIHIPSVNSREAVKNKIREVEEILQLIGKIQEVDEETGFLIVQTPEGKQLRIADLVDDVPSVREKVAASLRDSKRMEDRDYVDVIIALGMAKEGFDWIWCEHALTIGYRSSLTEVVQIIGRATRDAPGKVSTKFTNLLAEPDASEQKVTDAINDTLKAIAASLLMEQVLAPRFKFTAKLPDSQPEEGFDYGEGNYDSDKCNVGFNESTGVLHVEVRNIKQPTTPEAKRVCEQDLNEVIAAFAQNDEAVERGVLDEETFPEELALIHMARVVNSKYPNFSEENREAIRDHAVAALNLVQAAKKSKVEESEDEEADAANTALIAGIRKYALDVRELNIDLIEKIDPFESSYAILSKTIGEEALLAIHEEIQFKKLKFTPEEAIEYGKRAVDFKNDRGRMPSSRSEDPWERRLADAVSYLKSAQRRAKNEE